MFLALSQTDGQLKFDMERFGETTVGLTHHSHNDSGEPFILVTCDRNLVFLGDHCHDSVRFPFRKQLRVFPVDEGSLSAATPPVDFGASVNYPTSAPNTSSVLMVSGSKVLLAELHHMASPVQRHIPINGTPTKILFSANLQCLIVAVNKPSGTSLLFIDPESGKDLGQACEKKSEPRAPNEDIHGLGKPDDRIFGLVEWVYTSMQKVWRYIVVTTRQGRIIVISTARIAGSVGEGPKIEYWRQFQKRHTAGPVYSVVGVKTGLVYCAGNTLVRDDLDLENRKLKTIREEVLGSPATSLAIAQYSAELLALTSRDSVQMFNLGFKNNPVPAKETRWGSFNVLRDFNINAVKGLVEEAAADKAAPAGSLKRRVGDFYTAAMDSATIEKLGYTPIKADLTRVANIKDLKGIINEVIYMRTVGIGSPIFGFYVDQDEKNVNKLLPYLSQGGTTLPDRDYYLKDDSRSLKIRDAFNTYMTTLFTLTGSSAAEAKQKAAAVMAIEKQFAAAQMSKLEMRDPYKTYNKFAVAEFSKSTHNLKWAELFTQMKVKGQDTVLVNAPHFFSTADSMLTAIPVADWKTYLTWTVLKSSAPNLSAPFVNANFAFTQAQTGQKVQTPRWQRMASLTDRTLGELLGQLYVAKYFTPEAKARMTDLIKNLRTAFEIRIKGLDWMSTETKEKALAKLHAFIPKIGYPEKWKDYKGLEVKKDTYFQNLRNASVWSYNEMINKLGKPVDRTRFEMTPPTVNAYYNPTMNEIVFPAGILQFPFFDPKADDAVNYGGIGAVIGHEMSHGFDDSGAKYDKEGNLRDWWTAADKAKFEEKTKALGAQFDTYAVLDTIHVNGNLTMGENIGDLGGLNAAYTAFKLTKQGQSNEKIDGFTPDQRFFLSWAQVWRGNILDDSAAQQIKTDPHSPGEFRTIGAPVNMDAWYNAFDVKPGDKLYKKPEDRIRMW
uniref:M13 family metallopeptidase n=1 Tax=Pedobacter sp. TaxID=1411316 RepID=UPI003D7F9638